jgi:hypothetical protein
MRHRIQETLCRLASVAYQTKYIIHGTAEEYVLPDELLDSACSIIETTLNSTVLSKSLSQYEVQELSTLLTKLRKLQQQIPFNQAGVSNYELVQKNPSWLEASNLARRGLEMMGYDLSECEQEDDL